MFSDNESLWHTLSISAAVRFIQAYKRNNCFKYWYLMFIHWTITNVSFFNFSVYFYVSVLSIQKTTLIVLKTIKVPSFCLKIFCTFNHFLLFFFYTKVFYFDIFVYKHIRRFTFLVKSVIYVEGSFLNSCARHLSTLIRQLPHGFFFKLGAYIALEIFLQSKSFSFDRCQRVTNPC